jgi:hypothetical protein
MVRTAGDGGIGLSQEDERIAKILILLDPEGPIRLPKYSIHPTGIPMALAYALATQDRKLLHALLGALVHGLPQLWLEENTAAAQGIPSSYEAVLRTLASVRDFAHYQEFGFGSERLLYTLNPTLPCAMPEHHDALRDPRISTLSAWLQYAESYADTCTLPLEAWIDKEIGGFIAAKLGLTAVPRIPAIQSFPTLARHRAIACLHMLALAQHASKIGPLPQLARYCVAHIDTLYACLHSLHARENLQQQLRKLARAGDIQHLVARATDTALYNADAKRFARASLHYQRLSRELEHWADTTMLTAQWARTGVHWAMLTAYMITLTFAIALLARITL